LALVHRPSEILSPARCTTWPTPAKQPGSICPA